jgi:hypothetical protein
MSDRARVWNSNTEVYSEMFKDKLITIEPGKFVEMDYYDAVQFKGQWPGPAKLGKKFVKMIEVEALPSGDPEAQQFKCNVCPALFLSAKDLEEHSKVHENAKTSTKPTSFDGPRTNYDSAVTAANTTTAQLVATKPIEVKRNDTKPGFGNR